MLLVSRRTSWFQLMRMVVYTTGTLPQTSNWTKSMTNGHSYSLATISQMVTNFWLLVSNVKSKSMMNRLAKRSWCSKLAQMVSQVTRCVSSAPNLLKMRRTWSSLEAGTKPLRFGICALVTLCAISVDLLSAVTQLICTMGISCRVPTLIRNSCNFGNFPLVSSVKRSLSRHPRKNRLVTQPAKYTPHSF